MELAPLLVVFRYDDVPGVIGRVGTLFGEAGVNIANMTVSRTGSGGKALMALSIDTPRRRARELRSTTRSRRRRIVDRRALHLAADALESSHRLAARRDACAASRVVR